MNAFFDYLDRVRERPVESRRRLLWWLTGASAVLVVLVWLVQWQATMRVVKAEPLPAAEQVGTGSFFKDIPERIKLGWQKIFKK